MAQVRPLYWPAPYQDSVASGRLILRDGTTANIRVAQPEDREALRAFFAQLSPESKQKRFFSLATPRPEWIDSLCDSSNPRHQLTLIVIRLSGGTTRIIATGSYIAEKDDIAEVALAVDDAFHGKGLGSLLLERLALLAVSHGITRFWLEALIMNRFQGPVYPVNPQARVVGSIRADPSVRGSRLDALQEEWINQCWPV